MGVLRKGDQVVVTANEDSRFLLAAACPLNEPVARGDPFVMNTKTEIIQAFEDFKQHKVIFTNEKNRKPNSNINSIQRVSCKQQLLFGLPRYYLQPSN